VSGRKEEQKAEYQSGKQSMETGEAEADKPAPEEPLRGENGKKGKESAEAE